MVDREVPVDSSVLVVRRVRAIARAVRIRRASSPAVLVPWVESAWRLRELLPTSRQGVRRRHGVRASAMYRAGKKKAQ